MLLLLVLACTPNIPTLYEVERAAALAPPPEPPSHWAPELRLRLSEAALGAAASEVMAAGLRSLDRTYRVDNPLGLPREARPAARITNLDVEVGEDCGGCLLLSGDLRGRAQWQAGPATGTLPFTARVHARMAFETSREETGWDVTGRVVEVGRVRVEAGKAQALELKPLVRGWLTEALAEAPPLQVGHLGGEALPLRALRVRGGNGAVELQALSDVSAGRPVAAAAVPPTAGWDLRMHPDTALALMRRAAFVAGPGALDVAVDPRRLVVEGGRFTLDLRVWRLKGAGWWRDYTVDGTARVRDGRLRFVGEHAEEGERSRGAGLADPIALLGEGRILQAVEHGLDHSIPARRRVEAGDVAFAARAETIAGDADALLLSGPLKVRTIQSPEAAGSRGGKR